jgi:hypothetical protein
VSGAQPLVAVLVLGLLVYVGMGTRTAVALRRAGVPAGRAWAAGLLAWPLVRRAVTPADDVDDDGGRAVDQDPPNDADGHAPSH